jgi:endonuclease/exonuclease/phosphatase family metal-dependent hydrolase
MTWRIDPILWCLPLLLADFSGLPSRADEAATLRVLSYNIHHGEGVDGRLDLPRIAAAIRSAKPDLVALQEVDSGTQRTGQVDQPAELARLTGLKAVFGDNIPFQGGRYGNAVLSRLTVVRHQNHPLPSMYEGEQRGVLEVEVRMPVTDARVLLLATHLDYRPDDRERLASAKRIDELVARRASLPALLVGDLNAEPDSSTLDALHATWQPTAPPTAFTFPATKPIKQIDYVLTCPRQKWRVIEARVLQEPVASDHSPVLVVLELR